MRGSLLERLRGGEWPRLEDALVLLVASSPLSKPATNFALAAAIVLFARDWRRGLVRPQPTPLDGAIAAWAFASLLSGLTSIDPVQSFRDLRNLGHWSVYYVLAWGIAAGASVRRLENAWLAAGAACAAHAMLQAVFGIDLLGRAATLPRGFFGGHLELGHYMVVLFGLALARSAHARSLRERELLFVAMLAFGAAIILSGGRGPWLAFAAVGVAWTLFRYSRVALAGLVLVILLQVAFLARQPQGLESFYASYVTFARNEEPVVSEERLASNLWRLWMWKEGLRRFALRPLSGTGVETTGELSQDFRTPYADLAVAHLHSNYFEILMSRGFFGLVAFLLVLFTAARRMRVALARAGDGESAGAYFTAFAATLAHFVHGLTQFTFGASWIQIGFYVALGLGVGEAIRRGRAPARPVDPRLAAGVVAVVALAFLVLPRLAAHPWIPATLATLAALDLAARVGSRRASPITEALLGAFAFVTVTAVVLLGIAPGSGSVGAPVILAAAIPFGLVWLGWHACRAAKWLKAT